VSVGGELLLPTSGLVGFATRCLALLAIPVVLLVTRFLRDEEVNRLRALVRRGRNPPTPSTRAGRAVHPSD
jgi:hypothetical protein